MRKLVLLMALSCLPVLPAEAQTVTLSGQGTLLSAGPSYLSGFSEGAVGFSAVLPTSPVPSSFDDDQFTLSNFTFVFTQTGKNDLEVTGDFVGRATFPAGWKFSQYFPDGAFSFFLTRENIFTGSTSAPTFLTGTYASGNRIGNTLAFTSFAIAETPSTTVPEPSTYLLMASGLAALGVVARRRRQR